MSDLVNRFLEYVKIDTKSDGDSHTFPSTNKQYDLARLLLSQLKEMGVKNAYIDDNGYVFGEIKSNIDIEVPKIGFIAHMDTSPDFSGENVKPKFIKNYDGKDIVLNEDHNIVMRVKEFPELLNYIGNDLITTDGTTLLGADDKAGVAAIMEMARRITSDSSIKHGDIKIGFTPDEEVGHGADRFNVKLFGADFAYTVDGGEIGEIEYENFNAASALIKINGLNIHPGTAKGKMKNAILISMELNEMLPKFDIPAYTEGYEGFYHINDISGDVSEINMKYIVRDHSKEKFLKRKEMLSDIVEFINKKYGAGTVELKLIDSYFNMKEKIEPVIEIVDTAIEAMKNIGIEPKVKAIRGGTDGARLSYMGLPTPNLFTGGHNFHGKFEYIPVQSLEKSADLIMEIIKLYAKI